MRILLVDDNQADMRLVREALAEGALQVSLSWSASGEEALDHLRLTGDRAQAPPDLVLLDLNLPGLNGHEVLREIKQDPALRRIPVVVLTSSANPADVHAAYDAHANAYLVKPHDYAAFLSLLCSVSDFWLRTVLRPGALP